MPFTDRQVAALKPKATRYEVREPGRTGLIIRVAPEGTKQWAFRYRFNGVQHRMVLGIYPQKSLADARVALADAKKKLAAGQNPGAIAAEARQKEREAQQTAASMAGLVSEYLTRHVVKMRPATAQEDTRILKREILPIWPRRLAKDITRRDIMTLLNAIEDRGKLVLRNRVAGVLNRLFSFAVDQGIVDASPAINIKRLDEQPRDRYLSKEEIRTFWSGLDKVAITPVIRAALRWALVTGQRRGEIASAMREEIDDAAQVWRIPSGRTKSERDHLLPLPHLAMQVLAEADGARVRPTPTRPNRKDRQPHDATPSAWLFPSTRHQRPIRPHALSHALNRHRDVLGIGNATVHDLRRTFATWHGEIGTAPDILSALLNHAPTTITGQVYNQATVLEPKRRAMEAWSAWLQRVLAGEEVPENVIPISRARREVTSRVVQPEPITSN